MGGPSRYRQGQISTGEGEQFGRNIGPGYQGTASKGEIMKIIFSCISIIVLLINIYRTIDKLEFGADPDPHPRILF